MEVDLKRQAVWVVRGGGAIGAAIACAITLLAAVVLPDAFAFAEDAKGPAAANPSAAELAEGVLAEQCKIDAVRSLYMRFDITKMQPEAVEHRLGIIRRESPGEPIDVANNVSLWPKMTETLELAFDEKRLRKLAHRDGDFETLTVFDGARGSKYIRSFLKETETRQASLTLEQLAPEDLFSSLLWPRIRPRQLWFMKGRKPDRFATNYGLPSDYSIANRVEFRRRQCYVLENRKQRVRLYVGVDDRRLYGTTELVMLKGAAELTAVNKLAGTSFTSYGEFAQWLGGLSGEERTKFSERLQNEQFAQAQPCIELYFDEYRQLAPGFWFPAAQGSCFTDVFDPKPYVNGRWRIRLAEAIVNEPLDDILFTLKGKGEAK